VIGLATIKIDDLFNQLGDDAAKAIVSQFSCPLNLDLQNFLLDTNKALVLAHQKVSMTYLVFASYKNKPVLIGYYTLCNKYITMPCSLLSSTYRKKISRFADKSEDGKSYVLSAPLIAQLGKNFTNGYNALITGDELLKLALDKVREMQSIIGGKIVYLECEKTPKLIDFYERNGFCAFGERKLDKDETGIKGATLVQLFGYLG